MPYIKITSDRDQPDLDENATIWRYMDMPKLASMLATRSVFFTQLPHLGDPFEGTLIKAVKDGVAEMQPIIAEKHPHLLRTQEEHTNNIMASRSYAYASCWHRNEYESAAMWFQYAKDGFGVAVKSSLGRLVDSFRTVEEDVWIGQINYHDYNTAQPPQNSLWTPMFQKRKSFEHEREVRAVVMDWDRMAELRGSWKFEKNPVHGRPVAADLNALIEKIYLAPQAPKWFADVIRTIVQSLGYAGVEIVQSDMTDGPTYF